MPGYTTHPLSPPIFHFPPEKKLELTGQDLISILRYCQLLPGYTPPSREQTRAQYCADALDHVAIDPGRKRMIFRHWPRPPKGVVLTPHNTMPGVTIPNCEFWGETMFDFYRTHRFPDKDFYVTLTTGSKMMSFAKANNETEVAKGEIQWAETENKPQRLEPYSKKALERQERHLRLGQSGQSSRIQEDVEMRDSSAPVDIFHESNLPSPWPFVPFSYQPEPLQTRIPLYDLPITITVHDPWKVLTIKGHYGREDQEENEHWSSRPDITYTYRLQLTPAGRIKAAKELSALVTSNLNQEETTANPEGYFLDPIDVEGPRPPAVWIVPPPRPSPKETQPYGVPMHAHLYLSPSHKLGEGNHSVVYKAEWDVPRSLLLADDTPDLVHCQECGKADARAYLKETDGENGEKMEMKWKTPSAYNRKVVSKTPPYTMKVAKPDSGEMLDVVTSPGSSETRYEYEGDLRTVHTSVGWQDPRNPTCPHINPAPIPPPLARVRVAAKLSLQYDTHLAREADNYQKFQQHMFEHWNGLNLLLTCHDPVPNGPLVPQFYGYYVPEDERKMLDDDGMRKYLSPILLLELCGQQVNEDDLTLDEKNEAASLFYRFHRAGWTHNSPFRRNIVYQYGPLHVPYSQRHTERFKRQLSFRIIDFGRSEWKNSCIYKRNEEAEDVEELFGRSISLFNSL